MDDSIGASAWEYDARGALKSHTDALGKKVFYDYDPAGQLTTLALPAGATSPATTGKTAGQPTADKPVGISYSYDLAGRIKSQSSPWGPWTTPTQ
jgi:YD repeat-containing protein